MKKRILGLDTGSNSLGWAIVDREDDGNYALIDKGVVIFQEGVKIEKGIESSRAAERTAHRALRRQYFRRRLRKIEVLKVLVKYNLCPALTMDELNLWHTRKIYPLNDDFLQWQRTNEKEDINPYHSRHICLTECLNLYLESHRFTLGRALYHLAQRRGFLSNRLDANEEAESGAVKSGISNLSKEMETAGCKYLGEYFYKLYKEKGNKIRIRTRYIDRENHYKAEFYAICEKQNLSPEMIKDLERALYFQRPLKSQRNSVGKCTFEKNKARCSDSHPLFEEFSMLSFLNNVKIQGPYDAKLRPLNDEELAKIKPLFYRVSKANFDFEDIAKKIAGKGNYQCIKDKTDKQYKFNYRMTQGVPGCPTMAQLMAVFGEDWKTGIAETFDLSTRKDGTPKTADEMANDIWNVLYFFDNKEKLKEYAQKHLQLSPDLAEKFSKIKLSHDFSSLSLRAIRRILPFLRCGMLYSHAVFMGKIPDIVGKDVWNDESQREYIISRVADFASMPYDKLRETKLTLEQCIKDFLCEEYGASVADVETLYHPSMIETYPDARPNHDGIVLLGSPRTNAIRNPMAMRSLHEMRKVVNTLIKEGKVDRDTEVHVEYARELNNANMREAIKNYQKDRQKKHNEYAGEIKKLYKSATGIDIEPTETDVLKFQLWEEQGHMCLYTGKQIAITDFIGANPSFDIEHTIPRSVGGDSTQENMTLCSSHYNRFVKKALLPTQLPDYEQIIERIKPWQQKVKNLTAQIDKISTRGIWDKAKKDNRIREKNKLKMEREYWDGKCKRFTMTEVPEGFALRQGAGIGLISRYAALYLKSYFNSGVETSHRQVYSIKGPVTAEFRKMWGLQEEYEKKSRANHIHHCIDAIVIACIGNNEYAQMGRYHHQMFDYYEGKGEKPVFPKPWSTFTQDVKSISDELLVVHDTRDNMPKKACRIIDTPHGKKQAKGDCARAGLHLDKYYGAIKNKDEIKYVVRKSLYNNFNKDTAKNIVDKKVKEIVLSAFVGGKLQLPVYMNEEKGIEIKKVRCFANTIKNPIHIRSQRDLSDKDYKQHFHVSNDTNYCMAIYEGITKGKVKRDYKLVRTIDAAKYFKRSTNYEAQKTLVPELSNKGFELKQLLKVGQMVLLYESYPEEICFSDLNDISKRLYKIVGLSYHPVGVGYGKIVMRHHQEARNAKDITITNSAYNASQPIRSSIYLLHTQFNALVEGKDFEITPTGKIIKK